MPRIFVTPIIAIIAMIVMLGGIADHRRNSGGARPPESGSAMGRQSAHPTKSGIREAPVEIHPWIFGFRVERNPWNGVF